MTRALLLLPGQPEAQVIDLDTGRDDGARAVRGLVGGSFECLPPRYPDAIAYVAAEGKFDGLALNVLATRLWSGVLHPADSIVGPVVITGMGPVGDTTDVPADVIEQVTGRAS
jgi:Domain of unknown function (DUF3846)